MLQAQGVHTAHCTAHRFIIIFIFFCRPIGAVSSLCTDVHRQQFIQARTVGRTLYAADLTAKYCVNNASSVNKYMMKVEEFSFKIYYNL